MGIFVNKRTLSKTLGISEATLTKYQKDGMPIEKKGSRKGQQNQYDTEKVINWIFDKRIERLNEESPLDLTAERARLAAAQADKYEIEVRKLRKDVVEAAFIERAIFTIFRKQRDRLLALPERLSAQLATERSKVRIRKKLKDEIVAALLNENELRIRKGADRRRRNKRVNARS